MQSLALALTLSLLTGTLVALDLSDTQAESTHQTSSQALSVSASMNANRLAIMPNSLPGIAVPKADINNGAFAIGSSTDREGLLEDDEDEDDNDEAAAFPEKGAAGTGKKDDFVLI